MYCDIVSSCDILDCLCLFLFIFKENVVSFMIIIMQTVWRYCCDSFSECLELAPGVNLENKNYIHCGHFIWKWAEKQKSLHAHAKPILHTSVHVKAKLTLASHSSSSWSIDSLLLRKLSLQANGLGFNSGDPTWEISNIKESGKKKYNRNFSVVWRFFKPWCNFTIFWLEFKKGSLVQQN